MTTKDEHKAEILRAEQAPTRAMPAAGQYDIADGPSHAIKPQIQQAPRPPLEDELPVID